MDTERFRHMPEVQPGDAAQALDRCAARIYGNLPEFTYRFQPPASVNGFYRPAANTEWTTGFWTGQIWLAWEHTRNDTFKYAALIQVEDFLRRIENRIETNHHDMGFLYSPSCVAAYKLTGTPAAKKAALLAADNLAARFQEKGQFIQAWGAPGAADNYRLIIDCLLNVPLLCWASDTTGDERYRNVGLRHTETCLRVIVRPDNSAYHTFFFDPKTGSPCRGATCQGYKDNSAWTRGQAWGIYGTALSYRYTKKKTYLDAFRRMSGFYTDHLPADTVPYWDLDFGGALEDKTREPRDSSSAAIAACGFLEMAEHADADEAAEYRSFARKTVRSLIGNYEARDPAQSNGLLLHGTYSKKTPYNTCTECGVDECVSWGDYYYMEALTRLKSSWDPYW